MVQGHEILIFAEIIKFMKRICVYCGSSMGRLEIYRQAAENFGKYLAEKKIDLVYGGSNVGIMKVIADSVLKHGGIVIGVMPTRLVEKEIDHQGLHEMHVVETMAERKALMFELSDAFVALPGGYGTLDELSEILTYNQLLISDKPLALLNINGYFDHLLQFLDHGVTEGFIRLEHRNNIIVSADCQNMIDQLANYKPVTMTKWLEDIKLESSN